jgi:TPR repeat protein
MYYFGKGVPQNNANAMSWFRKAADQGDARAQYDVGDLYFRGKGVPQSYTNAVNWTQKAADQGYARAESGLAYMYSNGAGLPQSYTDAVKWYRKAADQGDAGAQHALGYMYLHGQGVPQDYTESARWIQRAADQGDAEAEAGLGYIYAKGEGVPQSRSEAIRWYRKAADQGNEYASMALSLRLTNLSKFLIFMKIVGGLALTFHFVPTNFLMRAESLRGRQQKATSATGILCLIAAGVSWYGYTHHQIRCLACGLNAFTWFKWLLEALMVAALIYIVRFKPEEQHSDAADEAPSPA